MDCRRDDDDDVDATASEISRWKERKTRSRGDSSFQRARRHFLPALLPSLSLSFSLPPPLPYQTQSPTPSPLARDFPRRLITPRRSSYKTLFNLKQRERAYITPADAGRLRTCPPLFVPYFLYNFSFLFLFKSREVGSRRAERRHAHARARASRLSTGAFF